MSVVVTGLMRMVEAGTDVSMVSIGRDTVIPIGVPVGEAGGVADGATVGLGVPQGPLVRTTSSTVKLAVPGLVQYTRTEAGAALRWRTH
jgi:hypothetical protein